MTAWVGAKIRSAQQQFGTIGFHELFARRVDEAVLGAGAEAT